MRVYHCIKLQEVINKYLNKKNEKFTKGLNTHEYQVGKEYIHFFRYYEFVKYYFNLGKDGSYEKENDNYILFMTANIPEDVLEKYKGFGFYFVNQGTVPIPEYAIPVEEFSSEYIVDITDNPIGLYTRENENQEYRKYIELIERLKNSNSGVSRAPDIADFLSNQDFEVLLGVSVDMRTEEEIKKEAGWLLFKEDFINNADEPIQEFKGK